MSKYLIPSAILLSVLVLLGGVYFITEDYLNNRNTITVVGEAKEVQKNEVATFTASASSVKENKQEALDEVENTITTIIEEVKAFGVEDDNIQTRNLSVNYYEEEEEWRVNNTVEIKLVESSRAEELANILTETGATNIYGPNFSVEDRELDRSKLLDNAYKNAEKKAQNLANSFGAGIGKAVSVTEGTTSGGGPITMRAEGLGGGGGPSLEPGSTELTGTVTVTFELIY